MKSHILEILLNKKYIDEEDLNGKVTKEIDELFFIEKQTQDDILKYYYCDLERTSAITAKSILMEMGQKIKQGNAVSYFFILFKDWNNERETLKNIHAICKNAKEKKVVNDVFNFMTSIYIQSNGRLDLKIEQEGINYLEYESSNKSSLTDSPHIEAKVYNLSMKELHKLFNVTGTSLFKLNVRLGILNKKAGRALKEEFKNYLRVGIILSSELKNDKEKIQKYFGLSDSQVKQYLPELFWYSHNGINIFVDSDSLFEVETEYIQLNPEKVSVINGAQTLTNIFLSKEELLEDLNGFSEENYDFEKIIEDVYKNIFVKTVFIRGMNHLSKQITWGLNNQIPIQKEDFTGISNAVEELNKLLEKHQMKILKTGQIENIFKGFTPLEFVKLFLIVEDKPGKSKNFDKSKLDDELNAAITKMQTDPTIVKKIIIALEVEEWWKLLLRETQEKTVFMRYGKNYFQSYVVHILSERENLDSFLSDDLNIYFEDINKYIKEFDAEFNDYKNDKLFSYILNKIEESKPNKNTNIIIQRKQELVDFINKNKKNNYANNSLIKRFNNLNGVSIGYFRTVSVINGKVKEHFPLPNSTFEEFYKRDGYMEDENYPRFANSLFKKELEKRYPVYVIHLGDDNNVIEIKIIEEFCLSNDSESESKAEATFKSTKEAFLQGDTNLLPKVSSNGYFHVRPKAINGQDTFQFTDGDDITKRTFWANSTFIEKLLLNFDKHGD